MIRIVGIVASLILLYVLLSYFRQLDGPGRKRFWIWMLFSLFFALVIYLTITGRLHFIAAIVTAVLPFAKKLVPLIRYVPVLRRLYKERQQNKTQDQPSSAGAGALSLEEAYQVLGLQTGASKEDVIEAHRKLMQKLHPDRGGNDYLAARLNQAKDALLKHLS